MRKAKKFLATFLSLAMIFSACSAVCLVKAAAGDYAGMVLNFETGTRDTATGTHPGYEAYYKNPTTRSGNATSYGGFSVGYVTGEGIGHNGSNGAMKMSYSANSQSAVNLTHAAFNVAHTGVSATELKNYRPYINQIFKATVWYKVDALTVDAELGIFTGYGASLEWGGMSAGKTLVSLTSSDIVAGWKSATAYFIGNGYSTATDTGYGSPMYITLKTADDTKRLGTEVYIDDIKVEHVGAAVQVKYELNKGKLLNGSDSESEYGIPGEKLKATAEREGYIFDGWYADAAFTTPVTDVPQEDATFYAKWKLGSFAGMKLNFETGDQDTATGTHPGYEAYYGKSGDAANGNATRVSGFDVGYVNAEGTGHNSNGAMRFAYSANSGNAQNSTHAAFNTAHIGTNANALVNYRPYYGQMFRATVWYKVESITTDAKLNFYTNSNYSEPISGVNLQYSGTYGGIKFADLTAADVEKGWQQASVTFMGGGSSTAAQTGFGSAGYIELVMSDDTNRVGTVVYVDDITIEHVGEAIEVKYNANGGTISGKDAQYGLAGDILTGTAEREGYEFAGWYADKDLTQPITVIPEANCTVYAKWEITTYAGMTLNFETGVQDTATGTHPGYETYYGKPGDEACGNASRVNGMNVGYVNESGAGHDSDGAMKFSYTANGESVIAAENAAFNTAHIGTNANTLANYRPYYGQMFRATVWYKADALTSDAELGFFVNSSKSGITNGINLSEEKISPAANTCGDGGVWHTLATLKASEADGKWHSASVEFMGGGSSDFTASGWGSPGYITLVMSDDTNRIGTVVYVDDITIEHVGVANKVNYELDDGTISNSNGNYEYGVAGAPLCAEGFKSGYKFMGWYSDANIAATVIPEEDGATLYAKWEKTTEQIKGDINGDGFVNAYDITLLRKFLLGIVEEENELYNVNGDEYTDIRDLVHLKKLVASGDQSSEGLMNLMDGKGGAETEATALRSKVSSAKDSVKATGTVYYISPNGSDNNSGKNLMNPWKTLDKIATVQLKSGDAVLLERGSVFRASRPIALSSGVTLGAYGTGAKPEIWGSSQNFAGRNLWKKSFYKNIWTLDYTGTDVGVIVFNSGEAAGRKVYKLNEIKEEYDFAHIGTKLYIYSLKNPNTYNDIEIGDKMGLVSIENGSSNVTISNITLKYTGAHAIWSAGNVSNITVSGCEIGWIGGSIQGTNDNYTLYGNAIEFWNKSENITVENNWIYQIYDTGITFQGWGPFKNIKFSGNLIEYTTMSIEYWCYDHDAAITGISIDNNIIRFSGYGWGAKRVYNGRTAHINVGHAPTDYTNLRVEIKNNIFDCSYQVIFRIPWKSETSKKTQKYTITGNSYYQRSRTGDNDLGLGGVENAAFAYGILEGPNDISSTASNQTELENAVKAVDTNPATIRWITD